MTGIRQVSAIRELTLGLRASGSSPEEAAITADSNAAIHPLIDALPEELRQPLALSTAENLTSQEPRAKQAVDGRTSGHVPPLGNAWLGWCLAGIREPDARAGGLPC
jgi:hypothetical protein